MWSSRITVEQGVLCHHPGPHKELLLWENEDHLTFLTNPEMIRKEVVTRVRPLVMGGAPSEPASTSSILAEQKGED